MYDLEDLKQTNCNVDHNGEQERWYKFLIAEQSDPQG